MPLFDLPKIRASKTVSKLKTGNVLTACRQLKGEPINGAPISIDRLADEISDAERKVPRLIALRYPFLRRVVVNQEE